MGISIITRAYRTSELKSLMEKLNLNQDAEIEVISVCNKNDFNLKGTRTIIGNFNRFQAKTVGVKNASYDKILIMDSDQIPESGLIEELDNITGDAIIIPERSIGNSFTSSCLNDWRSRNEAYAKRETSPYIPVIPRLYNKNLIIGVIENLPEVIYNIVDHEDSILYFKAFKDLKNIKFSKKCILNHDPTLINLMKKAYLYGKNGKEVKSLKIPQEVQVLINKLNRNTLNVTELGFGKGYVIQILRGIMYEFGKTFG